MRQVPKLWGCSKATVERDIAKGFEIRPLRNPRTAECFARNVLALVMLRDAKPPHTAGYVIREPRSTQRGRAHDRKVAPTKKPRKTARTTSARAPRREKGGT